jgi:hypothetical protein
MNMKSPLFVLGMCFFLQFTPSSHAAVIPFTTEAGFTDNFDPTTNYSWSSAPGVGGSAGRINSDGDAGSGNANRTYYDTTFSWSEDDNSLHLSVYFLGQAATNSTLLRQGVGISANNTTNFLTGGASTVGWRLIKSGTSSFSFDFKYGSGGSDAANISTANFNLVTNNWYKLDIVLTRSDTANAFTYSAALENWGTTGSALVSSIASVSNAAFTNAGLYTASQLYTGVAAANIGGGFTAFDQFYMGAEPIPEPSEMLLLSLGVGALWLQMRRKSFTFSNESSS